MKIRLFHFWCLLSVFALLLSVGYVIGFIFYRGVPALSVSLFFGDTPMIKALLGFTPVWGGIWPACVGSVCVVLSALALALLPGVATGIWLATSRDSHFKQWLALGVDILAGLPSVLMGLFGFTLILFLRGTWLPTANASLLLSALCLAMLILPYLAAATRTALLALPSQLTVTALSLGMTPWQTLHRVLLPQAARGIVGAFCSLPGGLLRILR